jgi:hypothetical protein
MVLFVVGFLQVIEAKFVATFAASHMVASLILVDCDGALRAIHSTRLSFPLVK